MPFLIFTVLAESDIFGKQFSQWISQDTASELNFLLRTIGVVELPLALSASISQVCVSYLDKVFVIWDCLILMHSGSVVLLS